MIDELYLLVVSKSERSAFRIDIAVLLDVYKKRGKL